MRQLFEAEWVCIVLLAGLCLWVGWVAGCWHMQEIVDGCYDRMADILMGAK